MRHVFQFRCHSDSERRCGLRHWPGSATRQSSRRISRHLVIPLIACCFVSSATSQEVLANTNTLQDRVERRLATRRSLDDAQIRVAASGRTVTLSGTVADSKDKERALQVARRTPGVHAVRDELTVNPGGNARRNGSSANVSDDELARRIARSLARETLPGATAEQEWLLGWEVEGDNWEFALEVDDGDVILSGTVNSLGEARRVVQDTRAIPGVRSVKSDLRTGDFNPLYDPYGPYYPYIWGQ